MGKWQDYYQEAVELALPYVQRAGDAAGKVKRRIQKEQRKIIKRQRIAHIARVVEIIANSVLLAAGLIALLGAIWKYFLGQKD